MNDVVLTAFEFSMTGLLIIGFLYEDRISRFERRVKKAIKRALRKMLGIKKAPSRPAVARRVPAEENYCA